MKVIVIDGQTFLDIAIQELADAERVFEVATLNGRSITDPLVAGEQLKVPDVAIDKKALVKIFLKPENKPASWTNIQEGVSLINEGVGSWGIGVDFIVS